MILEMRFFINVHAPFSIFQQLLFAAVFGVGTCTDQCNDNRAEDDQLKVIVDLQEV